MSTPDNDPNKPEPDPEQPTWQPEGTAGTEPQGTAQQEPAHNPFDAMNGSPSDAGHEVVEHAERSPDAPEREMGFFDHLEELRWRIIKALIALAVAAVACGVFLDRIVEDIILGPASRLTPPLNLQNTEPMGQITLAIQVALISGLIVAIPFILWQFWGFIKPGLYERERKLASWIAVATIACFLAGISFAYLVMIPTSLSFSNSFGFEGIRNDFTVANYFSFVLGFVLACGVVFEMPMLSYALTRFGFISPGFLRKYRRHAIIVILIVAAIITPTPDPFNQLLLAAPLYALYELSIYVSSATRRRRDEADKEWEREFGLDRNNPQT